MSVRILTGDCREVLRTLPDQSMHCCVTSPPYFGLRDYGHAGQIGLEPTPDAFVSEMVAVFREVRRVLRDDGTLWLNLGDSYAGSGKYSQNSPSNMAGSKQSTNSASAGLRMPIPDGCKPKDLIGIPWRAAFALQADGWYLRQDIIWSKPNPMPESVTDRCTKAHEYIFLMSKSARYFYDAEAIAEAAIRAGEISIPSETTMSRGQAMARGLKPSGNATKDTFTVLDTRNKRSVWTVATSPYADAHFATFPPALIEPCILAGCPKGGTVLDPFGGAGTTGLVADRLQRSSILIELNPEYAAMATRRIHDDAPLFVEAAE
jgi:DNA modification methylase